MGGARGWRPAPVTNSEVVFRLRKPQERTLGGVFLLVLARAEVVRAAPWKS